ncbi:MAG: hypothetical protein A2286_07840 [Gammaproteobacteria bacterium RIFOXYA12_FULL_61_12]|nr:MAG: hypothetical protein A2514_07930 [Gammaproteobacteria bacterium RIFOXYD12_FULL_61_37]OGT91088.1 MAG: hypothetical protein A2286_07840 [Gammaproteobacteria bacterium RIFOXYA12_FULL_61_12]
MIVDFIRHDPAVCMMPGLFRSFKSGVERPKFNAVHDFGDGRRLEFSGPDQLGADDLRVLQGLVSMALKSHKIIPPETNDPAEQGARKQLELEHEAHYMDSVLVKGSFADLAREIGQVDLDDTQPLRKCVERMWKVSVIAEVKTAQGRSRRGFRLIAGYGSDEKGQAGQLRVGMNPQIAEIMLGRSPKHTRIDMSEVRALKSDSARLIHQRLCGWVDPGKHSKATIDTICGYAWAEEDKGAMRMRRTRARKALQELIALGWQAEEYERGKYKITRPAAIRPLRLCKEGGLDAA